MIDNFNIISDLLQFQSEDDFYFLQILQRKKEHPELGSNSRVIQTYYITSKDCLQKIKDEIILLCIHKNARAYINLNKRSFEKCAWHLMQKVCNIIQNKSYSSCKQAFDSVCGSSCADPQKKWIIDIDYPNNYSIDIMVEFLYNLQPTGNKILCKSIRTKNGIHIITTPFNLQGFKREYQNLDVHKDNPTILFTL